MQALVTAVLLEKSQKDLPVTPTQSVSERQAPVGMVMLVAPTGLPAMVPSEEQRSTATCGGAGGRARTGQAGQSQAVALGGRVQRVAGRASS